jgi:hypothetical protein
MASTMDTASVGNIQSLTKSIMDNFDANKDGQFSADEFGEFLSAFVKSVAGSTAATGTASTSKAATFLSSLEATGTTATSGGAEALPPCLVGWSRKKWNDPDHNTTKYVAGRIMARYSPSDWLDPTMREKILADFRAAGLNATAIGKDGCDFGDGYGEVDIVKAAGLGGKAWRWGVISKT